MRRMMTISILVFVTGYLLGILVFKALFILCLDALARLALKRLQRSERARRRASREGHVMSVARGAVFFSPSLVGWLGFIHGVIREAASPWWFAVPSIGLSVMLVVAYYFFLKCYGDNSREDVGLSRVHRKAKHVN